MQVCGCDKKYMPDELLHDQPDDYHRDHPDNDHDSLNDGGTGVVETTIAMGDTAASLSNSGAKQDLREGQHMRSESSPVLVLSSSDEEAPTTVLEKQDDELLTPLSPPKLRPLSPPSSSPPPLVTPTAATERNGHHKNNHHTSSVGVDSASDTQNTSPTQRLKRTTLPVDPISESTAAQRLVEYFVVISCRSSSVSNNNSSNNSSNRNSPSKPESGKPRHTHWSTGADLSTKGSGGKISGQRKPKLSNSSSSRRLKTKRNRNHSSRNVSSMQLSEETPQPIPSPPSSSSAPSLHTPEPPPKERFFQPSITARYPLKDHRDNPLNPMILQFCFPTGEEVTPSRAYQLPRIHYFALTNDRGRKVYGICLTVMEDYHPTVGEKWTQQANINYSASRNDIEVSNVDEPVTTLYVPKVLCLLSTWPYLAAFREYLAQLYRLATASNVMTAPIERYIVNLCCEIPAPPPGAYELQLSILDSTIRFWAPPAKLPIAYVALPYSILFECLDLHHVLELFCALLMEHKIVLLSSQYSILTICSEILCSFLFPMKWSHLYIPLLPKMLSPMLDAPGM